MVDLVNLFVFIFFFFSSSFFLFKSRLNSFCIYAHIATDKSGIENINDSESRLL